jgi:hypothetical protein
MTTRPPEDGRARGWFELPELASDRLQDALLRAALAVAKVYFCGFPLTARLGMATCRQNLTANWGDPGHIAADQRRSPVAAGDARFAQVVGRRAPRQ